MINSGLVSKIWHQSGISSPYLSEMKKFCLETDASSPGTLAQLPLLFCEINGGNQQQVAPIITAWTLLRHAARLLDDIEDGDAKFKTLPEPVTLNISTGLLFTVGMLLNNLEETGLCPDTASDIRRVFYEELLKVCSGQHLDLTQTAPTRIEDCWQIVGAKSGVFIGLVCWAGGRVACADQEKLQLYRQFGYNLGLLDQIRDDLADLWSDNAHYSDLQNSNHQSLPIAYALSVLPDDERQKLITHLANSDSGADAVKTSRELIIQSGAGVYLAVQSTYYYQQNQQLLAKMTLPNEAYDKLIALLNKARLPTARK